MGDRHLVDKQRHQTRRPCTGRSKDAVVIFLFGLEALFTRDSRALLYRMLSPPSSPNSYQLLWRSNQLLLAPTAIKPVYIIFSLACGPWEKNCFVTLSSSTFTGSLLIYHLFFDEALFLSGDIHGLYTETFNSKVTSPIGQ